MLTCGFNKSAVRGIMFQAERQRVWTVYRVECK